MQSYREGEEPIYHAPERLFSPYLVRQVNRIATSMLIRQSQSRAAPLEEPVDSKQRSVGDPRRPASLGAFTGLLRAHLGMVRMAEHF